MMEEIRCILCGSNNYRLLYQAIDFKISHNWFNIVKCNNCSLVFTNPRPLENQIGKFYPNRYYSYKPYGLKKNREDDMEKPTNKSKILDIGCGSGKWLYRQKILGNDVYGVEISRDVGRVVNELGLNVFFGKLEDAKFPNDFFDLVRISHVLEHLYSPLESLKEVKRVLKRGGQCVISVPNVESIEIYIIKRFLATAGRSQASIPLFSLYPGKSYK